MPASRSSDPAPQERSAHGIQLVLERNHFYRDRYRLQLRVTAVALGLCLILSLLLFWVLSHPPAPAYFATTGDGRIIPLAPLKTPHKTSDAVTQWAAGIARKAYSFDFVHWRAQLSGLEKFFTAQGYQQFLLALKKSGNVQAVRGRRLVGSAVASPPVIVSEGTRDDVYTWRIEVPLQVSYVSAEQTINQSLLVTMLVRRVHTVRNEHGLAVHRFLTRAL